ncbi:shikimate kinase [Xanthovirga aplysinae]|uniref:shikimate kinase n=1 Tax=Xanthovirga aplysinae TaxID=2529853 RepID=UPI0012BC6A6D|nr:shikimate kinase [Xanthovirga aplysinae]MTI31865.1 shikimate kinase [Xanthovirga aplysinae]
MNYFLTGMPGSGKSTLGRRLAKHLSLDFIDLDVEIVKREGQSINQIFAEEGEAYFREQEKEALFKVCRNPNEFVLSTGGGAPCFFENMDFIKGQGLTLFLNVSPEELCRRMWSKGQSNRPLLKGLTKEKLTSNLREKLEDRLPFYTKAHLEIKGDSISLEEILERIKR